MMIVLAGERSLGAFLSEDAVFLRGQCGPPFGLCLDNFCSSDFGRFHDRFMLNRLNGLSRRLGLGVDVTNGLPVWLGFSLGRGSDAGWARFRGGRRGALFPTATASHCRSHGNRENRVLHARNQNTIRSAAQPWQSVEAKCQLTLRRLLARPICPCHFPLP